MTEGEWLLTDIQRGVARVELPGIGLKSAWFVPSAVAAASSAFVAFRRPDWIWQHREYGASVLPLKVLSATLVLIALCAARYLVSRAPAVCIDARGIHYLGALRGRRTIAWSGAKVSFADDASWVTVETDLFSMWKRRRFRVHREDKPS